MYTFVYMKGYFFILFFNFWIFINKYLYGDESNQIKT